MADGADNARHHSWLARAPRHNTRIIYVDAFKRIGKVVEIALPANFAITNDINASLVLVMQYDQGCIILCFLKQVLAESPNLSHPHARRPTAKQDTFIDQPSWLRITANKGRRNQTIKHHIHISTLNVRYRGP